MPEKTSDAGDSIEVAGIRFTAAEVESVTIKRDGRKIEILPKPDDRQMGFNRG